MTSSKIYFVVSCARSGSTSLTRVLDTATNGRCLLEPMPNLNIESRDLIDGRIANPRKILAEQVFPRIAEVMDKDMIYGEKNVTLGPFIPYLHEILKCKFIFLVRDGREVATSLMNWHNEAFGSIYRECKDEGPLSDLARNTVKKLPIELDTSDYSRPRPNAADPFFEEWPNMSRFEMVSWYWAFANRLILKNLSNVPKEDWVLFNYTDVKSNDIRRLFSFLGLEGFDEGKIQSLLYQKINSVEERFNMRPRFPHWKAWDANLLAQFNRISFDSMKLLGYYK